MTGFMKLTKKLLQTIKNKKVMKEIKLYAGCSIENTYDELHSQN